MNVFLLGFVLALVTYIASDFSYGVPSKVALDFGMGVTTLSAVGIAIFIWFYQGQYQGPVFFSDEC